MTTTTHWASTTEDLRLLAACCESGHLLLADLEHGLRLGIGAALAAAAPDRAADTAARILSHDDAVRAEFGGQVDVLAGYITNEGRTAKHRGVRSNVEPFTAAELRTYCLRTKAEVVASLPPEQRPQPIVTTTRAPAPSGGGAGREAVAPSGAAARRTATLDDDEDLGPPFSWTQFEAERRAAAEKRGQDFIPSKRPQWARHCP